MEVYQLNISMLQFITQAKPTRWDYLLNNDILNLSDLSEGKFGPAIAHEIHLHNIQGRNGVAPEVTINLKGLYVSSGFFDPLSQIDYSPFYNAMGLIDK